MQLITPLYDKVESMWVSFAHILPLLLIALLALVVTWVSSKILLKILEKTLSKSSIRRSLRELFSTLLSTVIWSVGCLIAVTIVFPSLTPAKLLAALGLGSIAIGLAFKDIFENFFAGILIMLRKPMRIGDFIECEGVTGKVEKINVRETYLRKTDDQLVILPNSFLFKNPLYILTDKNLRRFTIVIGVAYGEDIDKARAVIEQSLSNIELIDSNKAIEVFAHEFNSSSVDFVVRWWSDSTPLGCRKSTDAVVTAIKAALDHENIEIPFPYRTLTFKEPLTINNQ